VVLVRAPEVSVPEVALVPDQPFEAVQDVALVEDQLSVVELPLATRVGFAERDTVGRGGDTVTITETVWDPPGPVQERLKVALVVRGPEDWLPEVALGPDQPPEAVQDVAFVEDQVSVEDAPLATVVGFTASDTVGGGGGGGVPCTVTVVDAVAVPPDPVQERLNVVDVVRPAMDCVPDAGAVPDQPPVAVQEAASVEDQVSVEVPPLATDVGFAESDTVGKETPAPDPAPVLGSGVISVPQPATATASAATTNSVFTPNLQCLICSPARRLRPVQHPGQLWPQYQALALLSEKVSD
jgi:hypothetical protein